MIGDINNDTLKQFESIGGKSSISIADCVKNADVVITMLPNGNLVRRVFCVVKMVYSKAYLKTPLS